MTRQNRKGEAVARASADLLAEQMTRFKELFPEAFTEGKIDFDRLRATLGDLVDDGPGRYTFTWAGKRDAIRLLQTPIGEYNPDWAIVMEERDEHGQPTGKPLLYLVRETKSTTDLAELRPDERRKVLCGERHFKELGVEYKVVTSARELR